MSSHCLQPFGPVHPFPVVHYNMEFAEALREAFSRIQPEAIAVELPRSLAETVKKGVGRLPQLSVVLYENAKGESIYLPVEPTDPLMEALRLGMEHGLPVHFVDLDVDAYPVYRDRVPDPYAVHRLGIDAYLDLFFHQSILRTDGLDRQREAGMAYRLQKVAKNYDKIFFVCGLVHLPGVREAFFRPQAQPLERSKRTGISLFNLHPDDLSEVMGEPPFLAALYEYRRGDLPPAPELSHYTVRRKLGPFTLMDGGKGQHTQEEALDASVRWATHQTRPGPLDRQVAMLRLFDQASRHYYQDTGEMVERWQKRTFFRFSRNYALLESRLIADFYQFLIAARSCVDDNFCFAFWRLGAYYPWQRAEADMSTIRMKADMLWLGTRKMRIRRMLPRVKRRPVYIPKRRGIKERRPGEWMEGFDDPYICSYPPEDVAVENYGGFLKSKGALLLASDEAASVPFETTVLDGIDVRETVRHMDEGRLYVKEFKKIKGGVGSVVVIFDENDDDSRYPYLMTWLGEHDQESDMAFYATDPTAHIVGPGISRCTYGGFLMTYPPLRLGDVWSDPEYAWVRSKGEHLLLAGLEYSMEKYVVYVAKTPPRSFLKQVAARWQKQIIYIPLGHLSPVKIRRIRTLHVLSGKDKREIAQDYIW